VIDFNYARINLRVTTTVKKEKYHIRLTPEGYEGLIQCRCRRRRVMSKIELRPMNHMRATWRSDLSATGRKLPFCVPRVAISNAI